MALIDVVGSEQWERRACRGLHPRVFFPDPSDELGTARAKAICESCPIRIACLADALDSREPDGVLGGLTDRERRNLIRTHQRRRQQGAS